MFSNINYISQTSFLPRSYKQINSTPSTRLPFIGILHFLVIKPYCTISVPLAVAWYPTLSYIFYICCFNIMGHRTKRIKWVEDKNGLLLYVSKSYAYW